MHIEGVRSNQLLMSAPIVLMLDEAKTTIGGLCLAGEGATTDSRKVRLLKLLTRLLSERTCRI